MNPPILAMDDVWKTYTQASGAQLHALREVTLDVPEARRISIIGRSGSGKSTVARLITGLYQPWDGQILFDDIPRERIPSTLFTNSVAVVDQDIFMFEGSIRENLSMWDATVPDRTITAACKDSEIAEVIENRDGAHSG